MGQTLSGFLAKIQDPSRYGLIAQSLIDRMWEMGFVGFLPGHPLVLMALLAVLVKPSRDQRYGLAVWISAAAIGGMSLSYLGVFLSTRVDLAFYLFTSSDRVLLQIWPWFILLFCRLLPDDSGFAWTGAPQSRDVR
jgi:hypothetical protein